jgi:hypothetical protein
LVCGSTRDTVPSSRFATQTELAPTATSSGPSPTGIVTYESALGSMRARTSSPEIATQTASRSAAIPLGARPTVTSLSGPSSNVVGSKRWTLAPPEFETQTESWARRTSAPPISVRVEPDGREPAGWTRTSVDFPKTTQTEPAPT